MKWERRGNVFLLKNKKSLRILAFFGDNLKIHRNFGPDQNFAPKNPPSGGNEIAEMCPLRHKFGCHWTKACEKDGTIDNP
jgi:hypothetical protein